MEINKELVAALGLKQVPTPGSISDEFFTARTFVKPGMIVLTCDEVKTYGAFIRVTYKDRMPSFLALKQIKLAFAGERPMGITFGTAEEMRGWEKNTVIIREFHNMEKGASEPA